MEIKKKVKKLVIEARKEFEVFIEDMVVGLLYASKYVNLEDILRLFLSFMLVRLIVLNVKEFILKGLLYILENFVFVKRLVVFMVNFVKGLFLVKQLMIGLCLCLKFVVILSGIILSVGHNRLGIVFLQLNKYIQRFGISFISDFAIVTEVFNDWISMVSYNILTMFRIYIWVIEFFLNFLDLEIGKRNRNDKYIMRNLVLRKRVVEVDELYIFLYDAFLNVIYGSVSVFVSFLDYGFQRFVIMLNEKKMGKNSQGAGYGSKNLRYRYENVMKGSLGSKMNWLIFMFIWAVVTFGLIYGMDGYYPLSMSGLKWFEVFLIILWMFLGNFDYPFWMYGEMGNIFATVHMAWMGLFGGDYIIMWLEGYENLQGTVDWFDFFGIPSVFIYPGVYDHILVERLGVEDYGGPSEGEYEKQKLWLVEKQMYIGGMANLMQSIGIYSGFAYFSKNFVLFYIGVSFWKSKIYAALTFIYTFDIRFNTLVGYYGFVFLNYFGIHIWYVYFCSIYIISMVLDVVMGAMRFYIYVCEDWFVNFVGGFIPVYTKAVKIFINILVDFVLTFGSFISEMVWGCNVLECYYMFKIYLFELMILDVKIFYFSFYGLGSFFLDNGFLGGVVLLEGFGQGNYYYWFECGLLSELNGWFLYGGEIVKSIYGSVNVVNNSKPRMERLGLTLGRAFSYVGKSNEQDFVGLLSDKTVGWYGRGYLLVGDEPFLDGVKYDKKEMEFSPYVEYVNYINRTYVASVLFSKGYFLMYEKILFPEAFNYGFNMESRRLSALEVFHLCIFPRDVITPAGFMQHRVYYVLMSYDYISIVQNIVLVFMSNYNLGSGFAFNTENLFRGFSFNGTMIPDVTGFVYGSPHLDYHGLRGRVYMFYNDHLHNHFHEYNSGSKLTVEEKLNYLREMLKGYPMAMDYLDLLRLDVDETVSLKKMTGFGFYNYNRYLLFNRWVTYWMHSRVYSFGNVTLVLVSGYLMFFLLCWLLSVVVPNFGILHTGSPAERWPLWVDGYRTDSKQESKFINTFGREKGKGIYGLDNKIKQIKNPKLRKEYEQKYAEKYEKMVKGFKRAIDLDDYNIFMSRMIAHVADPIGASLVSTYDDLQEEKIAELDFCFDSGSFNFDNVDSEITYEIDHIEWGFTDNDDEDVEIDESEDEAVEYYYMDTYEDVSEFDYHVETQMGVGVGDLYYQETFSLVEEYVNIESAMDTEALQSPFFGEVNTENLEYLEVKKIHTKYPKYRKEEDVLLKEEFHVGFDKGDDWEFEIKLEDDDVFVEEMVYEDEEEFGKEGGNKFQMGGTDYEEHMVRMYGYKSSQSEWDRVLYGGYYEETGQDRINGDLDASFKEVYRLNLENTDLGWDSFVGEEENLLGSGEYIVSLYELIVIVPPLMGMILIGNNYPLVIHSTLGFYGMPWLNSSHYAYMLLNTMVDLDKLSSCMVDRCLNKEGFYEKCIMWTLPDFMSNRDAGFMTDVLKRWKRSRKLYRPYPIPVLPYIYEKHNPILVYYYKRRGVVYTGREFFYDSVVTQLSYEFLPWPFVYNLANTGGADLDKVGKGEKRKALMSAGAEDYGQAFVRAGFGMRDSFFKSQRIHLIEQLNPLVHEDRFIHSISDEAKVENDYKWIVFLKTSGISILNLVGVFILTLHCLAVEYRMGYNYFYKKGSSPQGGFLAVFGSNMITETIAHLNMGMNIFGVFTVFLLRIIVVVFKFGLLFYYIYPMELYKCYYYDNVYT